MHNSKLSDFKSSFDKTLTETIRPCVILLPANKRQFMKKLIPAGFVLIFLTTIFGFTAKYSGLNFQSGPADTLHYPEERNFRNIRQLTFGADNAEAYWSYDNQYIIFQRTAPKEGINCDTMCIGKIPKHEGEKFEYKMVSSGKGRTTCGFFMRDNKHVIYASTHLSADTCPPVPDRAKFGNRYIWPVYESYD